MLIHSAKYHSSCVSYSACPKPDKPEYAFIGRSNVGKSSLINMITGIKGLAKTSASPGKTRLINHFAINEAWFLVDLPGYGYARVSKKIKNEWERMISGYLLNRTNLLYTFVLVDARIPLQNNDISFINKMGENLLPFIILLTKCDKVSGAEMSKQINLLKRTLSEKWENLPQTIITSSKDKRGKEEILRCVDETNKVFKTGKA